MISGKSIVTKDRGKGPVLFTQIRAGVNGKPFKMNKKRTMNEYEEEWLKEILDLDRLDEPVLKLRMITHGNGGEVFSKVDNTG